MDITGKLIVLEDTTQVSDTFKKREFVVEYADNPQYPELIKFECVQDKCQLLDNFQLGQQVQVFFNLRGRKWTDRQGQTKYFNSLQAWRLNAAGGVAENPPPAQQPAPQQQQATTDPSDDIPF